MKEIKVKFINFWPGFNDDDNFIIKILRSKYNVILSDEPDYLFVSVFGDPFEYTQYDCIRILYTGEPFSPDFNVFDYAIGFDDIHMTDWTKENGVSDRYVRYPLGILYSDVNSEYIKGLSEERATEVLKSKSKFCNFIYSHKSYGGMREGLYEMLDKYKRVDSAGSFQNNMDNGRVVTWAEKIEFIKNYKFTIACESVSYPGFMTEKILHAFQGYTIPIYYGDPNIKLDINSDSFINVSDFDNMNDFVDKVREIDNNDELYLNYLIQPKEAVKGAFEKKKDEVKSFLYNIFDQEKESAYRRIRDYAPLRHQEYLRDYNVCCKKLQTFKRFRRIFVGNEKGIFI